MRARAKRLIPLSLIALASSSCMHSLGELKFGAKEGMREAVVELEPGDVKFEAHVRVTNAWHATAKYEMELFQNGRLIDSTSCDPLNNFATSGRSCSYNFLGDTFSCSFLMDCIAHVDQGGPTLVRARLSIPKRSADFELERADVTVGQGGLF